VQCHDCRRRVVLEFERFPDRCGDVPFPDFARLMKFSACGSRNVDARPSWPARTLKPAGEDGNSGTKCDEPVDRDAATNWNAGVRMRLTLVLILAALLVSLWQRCRRSC
jgi:hypothetical protein